MNIFVVDNNPVIAATQLCDRHVCKMIIECGQLLSNCFDLKDLAALDCPPNQKGEKRTHSYPHHPCSIWTKATLGNMKWVLDHGLALCDEKYARYPDKGRHFTHDFLEWVEDNISLARVPNLPLQNFPIAIKQDKNCRKFNNFDTLDRIDQYRLYYIYDKPFAKWIRNKPNWIDDQKYKMK